MVNAEATSIERFDAAKELDKELGVAESLKKELSRKTSEVNFAKSALDNIASQPVIKPEQVNMKITDPIGNTLEITAKKHTDSVKVAEPKEEKHSEKKSATLAKEAKHTEKQLAKVPSLTVIKSEQKKHPEIFSHAQQDSVPAEAEPTPTAVEQPAAQAEPAPVATEEPAAKVHEHQPAGANHPDPSMDLTAAKTAPQAESLKQPATDASIARFPTDGSIQNTHEAEGIESHLKPVELQAPATTSTTTEPVQTPAPEANTVEPQPTSEGPVLSPAPMLSTA